MGELLPVRRSRGFAVSERQGVSKAEKPAASGASQKTAGGTGLHVSETLRQLMSRTGQTEGLESRRTLQLGEGVLAEVQEKLGRMAELAEQAAGEGDIDRDALQAEMDRLWEEIDRMVAGTVIGGTQLFLDEASAGKGTSWALPDWLTQAALQGTMDSDRLLAALGLDKTASGADVLAALTGRLVESDPAAGYLAALYLGAVIAGGSQAGNLDPTMALDGLRQLLEKTAEGLTPDEAVALLTGGEYASLADFQEQFAGGTVPGLEDFLTSLLLSGGGETPLPELTLLPFLTGGMDQDLMMALMSLGDVSAQPLGGGTEVDLAGGEAAAAGAAAPQEAVQHTMMQFGELRVMGQDLSGVSFDAATGQLTVDGMADVVIQGTGQGEQTVLLTGSGTVTVQNVHTASLHVETAEARIVTIGTNVLGEVRLGEDTVLTIDGRGLLRTAALQGGEHAALHLKSGAVTVTDGESLGTVAVPVVLEGAASLAAQASVVRDPAGNTLEPFDIVWKMLLPGFGSVAAMALDGQQARMALLHGGASDLARLWLAKGDLSAHGYPAHTLTVQGRDEAGHARTRYAYLRWERRIGAFEEISKYPNPFQVTGGEQDRDWMYEEESHTLHILSPQVTGVSGGAGTDLWQEPFSGRIALMDRIGTLKLNLGGVVCRVTSGQAFRLGRENDVTLVLRSGTSNVFESGAGCAGISMGDGTSLRIDCAVPGSGGELAGTLTATGGTGSVGIGQDSGAGQEHAGHIMIRGGMVTGSEKPGQAGTVTITGSASASGGSAVSDLGSARTWARMSLFLQLGEDAVILPQFPLSSRTLQRNKLRVSTREYARAARMTIDADRRWVSQVQAAYSTLSSHLEQGAGSPVRDNTSAGVLLREVARSAPILSDRAMQARSLRSLEEVNRLLR